MKNVRVRETGSNGSAEVAGERHLNWNELRLACKSFTVEAAPLARRGHWLAHEATLALRRTRRRQERLRHEAKLVVESAERDEADAAAARRPAARAPRA